jgi:hypothetical protein
VLGDRPLRPGVPRTATSQFGDGVWDLTPAVHQQHGRKLTLHFTTVPERFRPAAKELFYALLAGQPPAGQPRLGIDTIRGHFSTVLAFLTWADRRGVGSLAALGAQDLAAYQEHLLTSPGTTPRWRQKRRHAVRLLWLYRAQLATDRLPLDPDRLEGWDEERPTARAGENRTERIPEAVLGPLLGWALRWVDEFAHDVLRATAEWAALRANTQANRARRAAPPARDVHQRLQALLGRYRADCRPLPQARNGGVNREHLARELDCAPVTLQQPALLALLDEAATEVGIADGTWLRTRIGGRIDGRPWRGAIGYTELPGLARQLHTACYLVIAYLSGMRDSEVKHLRRGCLAARRDDTGRAYRWMITSQAFKGEHAPEGVEATWVVGEPVGRAVDVLERLQPPDQPLLFAHLPSSKYFRYQHTNQAKSSKQTCRDLDAFVDWINAHCHAHGLPDPIPWSAGGGGT